MKTVFHTFSSYTIIFELLYLIDILTHILDYN